MPPVKKQNRPQSKHFLREWRDFRDMSLEEASELVDMSKENLGRIERGLVPYNQIFLELASRAYRCDILDLLTRNPLTGGKLWSTFDTLKRMPENEQGRILAAIEALTKPST